MGVEPFLLERPRRWACWRSGWCAMVQPCRGAGCGESAHNWLRGRTGIFELLVADDAIRALIHNAAAEATSAGRGAGRRAWC